MNITNTAGRIDNAIQGHAAELEKIHLLPVPFRDHMRRVRQADEWDVLICPISLEFLRAVWTNRDDLGIARGEFGVAELYARQLRAAIRSHETAQECKHNGFTAAKTR